MTTVQRRRARARVFEPVGAPRHLPRPRGARHGGALRADHRRARTDPGAPPREAPTVLPAQAARRVDDARRSRSAPTARPTFELVGASTFPRHWVYDAEGKLAAKAGLADFKDWYRAAFGKHTPWGKQDSKAYVTAVETALERQLSATIMRGGHEARAAHGEEGPVAHRAGRRGRRALPARSTACSHVVVDGEPIAEVGPGAILGERALLEGGVRTATLQALDEVPRRGRDRRPGRPRRARGAQRQPPAPDPAGRPNPGRPPGLRFSLASAAMRIATWNVNSLKARLPRVEEWLEYAQPDVLCIQETKLSDDAFPQLTFSALGYDSVHHGQGQWNGVAILSKVGIDDVTSGFETRSSTRTKATPGCSRQRAVAIRIVTVYVPNGREVGTEFYDRKLAWLRSLREWLAATASTRRPAHGARRLQRRARGSRRVVARRRSRARPT